MDQRNDNKPNPAAKPSHERGNTSPAGGKPDAKKAGQNPASGGAFGKEGHSNRTRGVDSTGAGIAQNDQNALDEDPPQSVVGDPHRARPV